MFCVPSCNEAEAEAVTEGKQGKGDVAVAPALSPALAQVRAGAPAADSLPILYLNPG